MPSMISHKRKWLFIHPPRTGGTSVSFAIKPLFQGDADGKHYGKHYRLWEFDINPKKYFKFMTVRNPWVRVASYVGKFVMDGQQPSVDRAIFAALPLCEYGLEEMDFVLRCEHLEEDFTKLCRKLRIAPQELQDFGTHNQQTLRKLNQSARQQPHRECFTGEQRKIVEERFGWEIRRFGYKF